MMDEDPTCDERRQRALVLGFRSLAKAFLRRQDPSEDDLGLLYVAVVDAAMAGDQELVSCVPLVTARLLRYLPEGEPWSEEWRGRLWGLESAAAFGKALLRAERAATLS